MTTPTAQGSKFPGIVECPLDFCQRRFNVKDILADLPQHTDQIGLACPYEGPGNFVTS